MRAGTLRRVGTLQRQPTSRDPTYGGPSSPDGWIDVATVRYALQTTQGHLIDAAGYVRGVTTSTIVMRYLKGVQSGMRIKSEDGRFYRITAVNDLEMRHRELELTVVEGLAGKA